MSLMFTKAAFIWSKYSKKFILRDIIKMQNNFLFLNVIYFWFKAEFSAAITQVSHDPSEIILIYIYIYIYFFFFFFDK